MLSFFRALIIEHLKQRRIVLMQSNLVPFLGHIGYRRKSWYSMYEKIAHIGVIFYRNFRGKHEYRLSVINV